MILTHLFLQLLQYFRAQSHVLVCTKLDHSSNFRKWNKDLVKFKREERTKKRTTPSNPSFIILPYLTLFCFPIILFLFYSFSPLNPIISNFVPQLIKNKRVSPYVCPFLNYFYAEIRAIYASLSVLYCEAHTLWSSFST